MKKLLFILTMAISSINAFSQATAIKTEEHTYKTKNGRIVLTFAINGVEGDFLLDLVGKVAILPAFAEKIGIKNYEPTNYADLPVYRKLESSKKTKLSTIAFGDNVYGNGVTALLLDGESATDLKNLGVDGVVGGNMFKDVVLTIDKRNNKVYTSLPFKPSFVQLKERADCEILLRGVPAFEMKIANKRVKVIFDTWQTDLLSLNSEQLLPASKKEVEKRNMVGLTYSPTITKGKAFKLDQISLVNINIKNKVATINPNISKPVVGLGLLDHGLLSIDFSKSMVYFQTYESTVVTEVKKVDLVKLETAKVNAITKDEFLAYIFDYKKDKEFILKGDKPVVIDFWATWCAPCMKLSPYMDELAKKYKDKVIFYKIDADKEKELCSRFNVSSLPTLFFIPAGKAPIVDVGGDPAKIKAMIEQILLK